MVDHRRDSGEKEDEMQGRDQEKEKRNNDGEERKEGEHKR